MPKSLKKQISSSLEDYLEVIYEIIEEKHGVKAVDISRKLGVGRSSVTDALKALSEKKLVNYGRYEVISLTEEGQVAARGIVKKHSVLSTFFSEVLGLSVEQADKNACRVEHVISDEALEGFIRFMNERGGSK